MTYSNSKSNRITTLVILNLYSGLNFVEKVIKQLWIRILGELSDDDDTHVARIRSEVSETEVFTKANMQDE